MGQLGQLFGGGGLTNTALADPNTGKAQWFGPGNNQGALQAWAQGQRNFQPSLTSSDGTPLDPSQSTPAPSLVRPSFEQAASMGAMPGGGNAMSPGLTKAGKLMTLLSSGVQGALAGRAANEQATIASGGRRSGGAGMGFEAGYTLPWQRAGLQQQYEQEQAKTNLLKAQADMVPTQYGPMPAALARYILPAQLRAGATEQAAQTRAGASVQGAEIGAQSRTGSAQIGADARIKAAQLGLGPIAQVPQDLQDQFGLPGQLPLRMLNQAESAANKPLTVVQGESGPAIVNKQQAGQGVGGTPRSLGIGSPRLGGAMQVADPDNPGQTKVTTSGQAVRSGAAGTQSASLQVPRQAAKSEVPTDIGNLKVGFTTMIQHAQLIREAAKALNNGDTQTLSGLRNAFKNEFGYSGPITAQAIADAYGGEVTNVIAKGHITNQEMNKTGKTIDLTKQNFQTVDGVLSAYQALAQSKMNMLDKQEASAIAKSQPKNKNNDPLEIR